MSEKQQILDYIETNKYSYIEISHRIHERPELGNEEIFASRTLIDRLKEHDFEIETEIAGHATGFIATYDSGLDGPAIGFLAEYDALPGLGHACGHNIIGTASVLGAIGLKQVIDQIGGKVVVLGCPAEEGGENGSAKASYVKAGVIDQIDIALMIHPGNETYKTIDTLAVDVLDVKFYGKSAHASENADEALNALDAMISYFNGVAQLRQLYTRAMTRKELDILTEKVNQIARGAAIQTGCDYEFGPIQNGVNEFIKTPKLDDLFAKYAEEVGEAVIDDDFGYGSTDTGNVSHVVPTIHPHIKIGSRNLVGHTHRFREAAASVHGDEALIKGAKIMALMGLELITNQDVYQDVIEEHAHLKGNGK
ncbi:TPA: M20 family metallopeptidase [Staphylococcus aureus]|nr:M20 family metallopeptidase [Staphylococcus aureus]